MDRHLDTAQPESSGARLHLHCPAEVRIGHLKLLERGPGHRPERPEIREADAPKGFDEPTGEHIPEVLNRRQCARLGVPEDPRADHQVRSPTKHGPHHRRQILGIVGAIGIEENNHFGGRRADEGQPCKARRAISPARTVDHLGPPGAGHGGRVIGASVVDHHDAPQAAAPQSGQDGGQALRLIEGGQ